MSTLARAGMSGAFEDMKDQAARRFGWPCAWAEQLERAHEQLADNRY